MVTGHSSASTTDLLLLTGFAGLISAFAPRIGEIWVDRVKKGIGGLDFPVLPVSPLYGHNEVNIDRIGNYVVEYGVFQ